MVDCAWRIVDAVDIPVFADGDNGHGNVTNVIRTVQQFEKAGAAGLFIEDQVFPKRCGHTSGKQVIPAEEMFVKLKAAVDTRSDQDFVIMARTCSSLMSSTNFWVYRRYGKRKKNTTPVFRYPIESRLE